MENVINSSKSSKSNTSSEKDVKDEAIALLDKRLEDMTVNLQAALDVSAENFSKRVAALEATLAAVQAHGTSLKVSEPTKESIAAAATKRELRKALLTGIDEHVAACDLEGDLPKLLHIERRHGRRDRRRHGRHHPVRAEAPRRQGGGAQHGGTRGRVRADLT